MEIVIKIPEEDYELMKYTTVKSGAKRDGDYMRSLILNGTPLPKGHGRLIDADELYENTEIYHSDIDGYACVRWKDINDAPTIIEADKESEE